MPPRSREDEPAAPPIPSFASLRGGTRRSAVDVLVPGPPPGSKPSAPSSAGGAGARPPAAARPAEYADLVRLGLLAVRTAAGVPWRVARWSLRRPGACARRLLGS